MSLPDNIRDLLAAKLGSPVSAARAVHGGDINQAAKIALKDGTVLFVKWHPHSPEGMFTAEARGLQLMAAAEEIRVPGVLAASEDPAFLALEWLEEPTGSIDRHQFAERFGHALAALHRHEAERHGLDHDNYIGSMPQHNTPDASWSAFYRDQRIGKQMHFARQRGRLTPAREDALTRLMDWLPVFLDDAIMPPSLMHGDLWSGNYMIAAGDQPVLIDPAVYYGHREMEIAFTELFGGFPARFYDAYNDAYPLDAGYADRKPLYQLYHLLNHMNLFGGGYASSVDRILQRYVG